ncbi:unnamed protein product [Hymenolepis diminuta]|uniref:PITH domain-containing protein n=1 Tax=Hymenolepis diminuta TaxID=6216 RepID=A0A0R3SKK1_HYMDI|nr:unnamed protein product [Hymenolepis diminuta]
MPFQKRLGESTEVIFLHSNVVIETFHSVPDHVAPEDKKAYIDDNSVDLLDYKGAEGKQLNLVEVELPIIEIQSVKYDKGMLSVNGFLIGPVPPCEELRLCLRDLMETDTVEEDMQMPMLFKLEEPEIKQEEPEIKQEEPEIKKESIFVDNETKKEALYGFLGGGLAGLVIRGPAGGMQAGLGAEEIRVSNFTPIVENSTPPPFTQSINIVDSLINIVRHAVENLDEFFHVKKNPDKEPLIKPDPDGEQSNINVVQETSAQEKGGKRPPLSRILTMRINIYQIRT